MHDVVEHKRGDAVGTRAIRQRGQAQFKRGIGEAAAARDLHKA